jgi:hypothetical protein
VQIPTACPEIAEVLPALTVQHHHLAVQDRLLDRQLLPDPVAEVLESLEDVSSLGPEMTAVPGDVQQPAVPVVFGLEEPSGVIERIAPRGE